MKLTVFILFGVTLLTGCVLTGCAIGGGASVYKKTTMTGTNVTEEVVRGRTLPFIAWGDARQAITSQKVSNTKTGNSIGQGGLEQVTSATNVAPILHGAGSLIGEAARTFMGAPPVGQ